MGRLSQGQMIAAVGGIALLVAMFLPWTGASSPSVPGVNDSLNLWKVPGSTLDIYLLITGVVALLPALMAVTDSAEEFSFVSAATLLLGAVAVILVISWLTFDFPDGAERKIGAFTGLGAAIVIAVGGFRAMQEEVVGEI
jgi:hypothetical protein